MEYEAQIHGLKIDKSKMKTKKEKEPDKFLFGDPESYKSMTKEERIEATRVMKAHHQKGFGKGM
jgi:hypothetical protein